MVVPHNNNNTPSTPEKKPPELGPAQDVAIDLSVKAGTNSSDGTSRSKQISGLDLRNSKSSSPDRGRLDGGADERDDFNVSIVRNNVNLILDANSVDARMSTNTKIPLDLTCTRT